MPKKPTGKPRGRPRISEEVKLERKQQKDKQKLEKAEEKYKEGDKGAVPYCGIGKPRLGQPIGSMKDCLLQNKVGLFGLKQIDPVIIKIAKLEKAQEVGETKILKERAFVLGKIKKLKELIKDEEGTEDDIKKAKEELKKLRNELKELNDTYEYMRKGNKKKIKKNEIKKDEKLKEFDKKTEILKDEKKD